MKHISGAVKAVIDKYNGTELIIRIIVGLIAGTILALIMPHHGSANSAPCSSVP